MTEINIDRRFDMDVSLPELYYQAYSYGKSEINSLENLLWEMRIDNDRRETASAIAAIKVGDMGWPTHAVEHHKDEFGYDPREVEEVPEADF